MVDRRYREEFTPFHFDLVINDEAHRSIYGDAREVVQVLPSHSHRPHGYTEGVLEKTLTLIS